MEVVTHARVKYLVDGTEAVIPIQNILEFQEAKPTNKLDFQKSIIYHSDYTDKRNPESITLTVKIADLACKSFLYLEPAVFSTKHRKIDRRRGGAIYWVVYTKTADSGVLTKSFHRHAKFQRRF